MMWVVWVLVAVFAGLYALKVSPQRAFRDVYLPILIFVAQDFKTKIPSLPVMTLSQAVIIPIFFVWLFYKASVQGFRFWRWSWADALLIAYIGFSVISIYQSEGMVSSQTGGNVPLNRLAELLSSAFAPYVLAKSLLPARSETIRFSQRFVFLIFVVILISLYEMRFVTNLLVNPFKPYFPDTEFIIPAMRWGLVRIRGSFSEPIYFGIVICVALFFHYWLVRNQFWKKRFSWFPFIPINKSFILFAFLLLGLIMTLSRGPLLCGIFGSLFLGIGFARHRLQSFAWRTALVCVLGIAVFMQLASYSTYSESLSSTELATITYRQQILEKYMQQGMEYPYWGWNFRSIPSTDKLPSIDNHYFWLFLRSGIIVTIIFIMLIGLMLCRLIWRGLTIPSQFNLDNSVTFTFLSILVAYGLSLVTVFMGAQLESIFFLLVGWMDGFLLTDPIENPSPQQRKSYQL